MHNPSIWSLCPLNWKPLIFDVNDPLIRIALANLEIEVKQEEGISYWRRNIDDPRLELGL